MEARFGHDFSRVRVHTDTLASRSAAAVSATAYTVGSDVVFASGRYAPSTSGGRRLLAHELAHVVQQEHAAPAQGPLWLDAPGSGALERDAARAATEVGTGCASRTARRSAKTLVQRSIGSPAGGCGVCYGTPAAAGIAAHEIIELAFLEQYPWLMTEVPLLLAPSPTDDNGRLDLAGFMPDGSLAIAEIKPANPAGMISGDLDLMWYEDQLHAQGIRTTRLMLPPPFWQEPIPFPTLSPGCPTQEMWIEPPSLGIYMYFCEPDFRVLIARPECRCRPPRRERERVPVPVPVPERVREAIREWLRRAREMGEEAYEEAKRFLEQHPELLDYLAAFLIGVAVGIVIGTIVEDILTAGGGILDDPASFAAAAALVRAAMEMLSRGGQLTPVLAR